MELSKMDRHAIEKKVTDWLSAYGYSFEHGQDIDIVKFARHHGFIVGNAVLDDNDDGFLAIHPRRAKGKVIGVNSNRSLEWKRFIIAHELAHFALHYDGKQVYLHREHKSGRNDTENEADYFAAALLMPRESFRRVYETLREDGLSGKVLVKSLAEKFIVPVESAERRIPEVGIDV